MPTGAYIGKTSNNWYFNVLILPNGDYWGIVGTPLPTGGLRTVGSMTGRGGWKPQDQETFATQDAKGILYSPVDVALPIQTTQPIQMSTRFTGNGAFSGQATTQGFGELVFGGNRVDESRYDILAAPVLGNYTGVWDGFTINQAPTRLEIRPDGTFSGVFGTCAYAGQLRPHPQGFNLFAAELNVGPALV